MDTQRVEIVWNIKLNIRKFFFSEEQNEMVTSASVSCFDRNGGKKHIMEQSIVMNCVA